MFTWFFSHYHKSQTVFNILELSFLTQFTGFMFIIILNVEFVFF